LKKNIPTTIYSSQLAPLQQVIISTAPQQLEFPFHFLFLLFALSLSLSHTNHTGSEARWELGGRWFCSPCSDWLWQLSDDTQLPMRLQSSPLPWKWTHRYSLRKG